MFDRLASGSAVLSDVSRCRFPEECSGANFAEDAEALEPISSSLAFAVHRCGSLQPQMSRRRDPCSRAEPPQET